MKNKTSSHRLINALLRQPVDRTPIWIMRQAGRYLPEYRELRAKAPNFMTFCKTPALTVEATLQPLRRFNLDAAIVFSDILTIPEAMGMTLDFVAGEGPCFRDPIATLKDVESLLTPDVNISLSYVFQTIEQVVKELNHAVPLIGFAGSPWTVACYMIEGQTSKDFYKIRKFLYRQPEILKLLLARLTQVTIDYLNGQIKAGAEVIMLFDTWGGILSHAAYQEFSLYYLSQIAANLLRHFNGKTIPIIFFTKNGGQWLELIADSGCDAIGLDWTTHIGNARQRVGQKVALQGNLDPALLFSDPDKIQRAVQAILNSYGKGSGHVFNLGHGIDQSTPIENVAALVNAVTHTTSIHV